MFLKVISTFKLSTITQVTTQPTIIINLFLASLKTILPFMLLNHSLHNYFAPNGLNTMFIPFNLGIDNKVNNWPVCVLLALSGLRHLQLCHSPHHWPHWSRHWQSLPGQGQGQQRHHGCHRWGRLVCFGWTLLILSQFLAVLLEPFHLYLPHSVVYFLACGSIVGNKESFSLLHQAVRRYSLCCWAGILLIALSFKVGHTLAFDAPYLVILHTTGLLLKLTRNVVVHHIDFVTALEHLLWNKMKLDMHTELVHITPDIATCYVWTHKQTWP